MVAGDSPEQGKHKASPSWVCHGQSRSCSPGWLPRKALPSRLLCRAAHPSIRTRHLGFVAQRPIYCWGFSARHAEVSLPVKWGNLIYPPATCPSACGVLGEQALALCELLAWVSSQSLQMCSAPVVTWC